MLKETFFSLLSNFTNDSRMMESLWQEIDTQYSSSKRYYHTITHLDNLLQQLFSVKDSIGDWDSVLFSLYYHDIVYDVEKMDNELQSAMLAEERMRQMNISDELIAKTTLLILSTKNHLLSADMDTNYFIDADLSVLGNSWNEYSEYYQHIRKEYAIYSDVIYIPGRKKVLNHFLVMDRIFKTAYFYEKYERQAKHNLIKELASL